MVQARHTPPWIAAGVSLFLTCGDDVRHVEFVVHVDRIEAPVWVAAVHQPDGSSIRHRVHVRE